MKKTLTIFLILILTIGMVSASDQHQEEPLTTFESIQNTVSLWANQLTGTMASTTGTDTSIDDLEEPLPDPSEAERHTPADIDRDTLPLFSIVQDEVNPGHTIQYSTNVRFNPDSDLCDDMPDWGQVAFYLQGPGVSDDPQTAYQNTGTITNVYCDGTYNGVLVETEAPEQFGEQEYELHRAYKFSVDPPMSLLNPDWSTAGQWGSSSDTVTIERDVPDLEADISAPSTAQPNERVTLDASASQGEITSYRWSGDVFGSRQSITETFRQPGRKTIELEISDSYGNTDTTSTTINVEQPDINARIEPQDGTTGQPGDRMTFDASQSTGEDLTYDWGGDIWGTGQSITETFDREGTHTVELTVIDDYNQQDTDTVTVDINYEEPEADFSYSPSTIDDQTPVNLDGTLSQGGSTAIVEYEWDIEGERLSGQRPSWTPETDGEHTIELTVTDQEGHTDTHTETINVEATSELSGILLEAPNYAVLNEPTDMRFVEEEAIVEAGLDRVEWEIENKGSRTGEQVSITFDQEGSHNVEMTVIDNEGQEVTSEKTIIVQEREPTLIQRIISSITGVLGL